MSDAHDTHFTVRQEPDAIGTRRVVAVGAVGLVIAAAAVAAAGALLFAVDGSLRPSAAGPGGPTASRRTLGGVEQTPILDSAAGLDLRNRQRAELEQWGWASRDAGVATIPIDRAIDVFLSREAP
ncbi:MAG: hypothetical protein FWD17_08055 [Polyangiaceae bacterium]|nr:hypothetical protein [Polyangiaceae bacterium]